MSPFAGEGANLAMLDGAELAAALLAHPDDPERAITTYETALFPRSERSARESAESLELCFGPDAAVRLAVMMSGGGGTRRRDGEAVRPSREGRAGLVRSGSEPGQGGERPTTSRETAACP